MSSTIKPKITQAQYDAIAFSDIANGDYKNAARMMWPWFKQNAWTDRIWEALNKYDRLCIMGHGSASKTFTASVWFLLDWLSYSDETALIITSDTIPSMDRRIWADFKTLISKSKVKLDQSLQIVDAKRMIRTSINDGKNAIHAIAAESDDAQSKIQGLHTKRVRVIIDEADNPYSSSIWAAMTNLETSGQFKFVALANPADKNSEFGRQCEPENGYDSIDPETDKEWDSKLGCHVIRLDGLDSPNIIAGEDKYEFLLRNKAVTDTRDRKGTLSPEWWTYIRAWFPPEGAIKTIFPGGLVSKCLKPVRFYGSTIPVAACDPAFEGGDSCIVVLGRYGRKAEEPEKTIIQVQEFVVIKRKDTTKPLGYDYADQIVSLLKDRDISPANFAIDTTGTQGPFADIIQDKHGTGIMRVLFGGNASNRKITAEDTAPAKERFRNFVTELWYATREYMRLGQLVFDNIPRDLRIQLESRRYELKGKDAKSGREVIQAEPKSEMKERGLSSPDYADALAILVHLVRSKSQIALPISHPLNNRMPSGTRKSRFKNATTFNQTYGVSDIPVD